MKRFITLLLIIVCITCSANAETDLSSLSYTDLLALQKAVVAEIISRPEWKQVEVPVGQWIIGEDIPEGYYSITAPKDHLVIVKSTPIGSTSFDFYQVLGKGETAGKVFLKAGCVLEINEAVILSPPISLGF